MNSDEIRLQLALAIISKAPELPEYTPNTWASSIATAVNEIAATVLNVSSKDTEQES